MIEVHKLNKTYDRYRSNANHVLRDVSFTLPDTGFVCILGPSGCGKTSLLNAMGGLDTFDNGTLSTEDVSVSRYGTGAYEQERNRNFGYIFQNYYLLENHSVAYNVYLGLHSLDLPHTEKLKRVRLALKAVDMERYIRRTVGELSGGQQQRIAIARALARRPKVIFADEPTGNLDEANTRNICTLLRQASKESLVIMVTHEERIARFFADRIIVLEEGRIAADDQSWHRDKLSAASDKVLYAGDYAQQKAEEEGISLRLLRQGGAAPVELTVVALNDRIVIKLKDSRPVSLSTSDDTMRIEEGTQPVMTLETVDRQENDGNELFREPPAPQCKSGKGITGGMMFREARELMKGKGARRAGLRLFLVLLTVLALLVTGDFIAISRLDPEDFSTADSHVLKISMSRGSSTDTSKTNWNQYYKYWQLISSNLESAGLEADAIPNIPNLIECSTELFYQLENEPLRMPGCSQVPLARLDESTLIHGRMPQHSWEIVVDRQVLEASLEMNGVVQKSIKDITFFLDIPIQFGKKAYTPTIVGICDSGERAIYMSTEAMLSVCSNGTSVITLSELQELCPGVYDNLELVKLECAVILNNAGQYFKNQVGRIYRVGTDLYLILKAVYEEPTVPANIIVSDETLELILLNCINQEVTLYCPDKASVAAALGKMNQKKTLAEISGELAALAENDPTMTEYDFLENYLENNPEKATDELWLQYYVNAGLLEIKVSDPYGETYRAYQEAAGLRANGRTIVIATLLVLSMVMLYLLCRAQVQERLGLLAVYRLLGIPGGKLYGIFLLEGTISALRTILPAALLTWAAAQILNQIPEIELTLILPWQAAAAVSLVILGYYLLVSLLPLSRLLKLPPAQLAAKYDI